MAISDFSESERQERKLYRPLLSERRQIDASSHWKTVFLVVSTVLIFAAILYFGEMYSDVESSDLDDHEVENVIPSSVVDIMPISRGKSEGVSEKANQLIGSVKPYDWTNAMLKWQRTGYHFQPEKNWMNDPNGPLHHKGWYHLFYQYNPDSAVWGNITWGHAISKDLIHWLYLDLAMVPDHWYDINGVWTGSATILPDGNIIMIYTGSTNQSVQVQNVAFPKNISDPLLLDWVKYSGNPVLTPPKGINYTDFRDPTTAWYVDSDGSWRITIGSKINKTGLALVYETKDFLSYELLDGVLHSVAGTGMWECIDFYPVSENGSSTGLDTSVYGDRVKHVMKASMDDTRYDTYAIGHYNETTNIWTPDNPEIDVGIGLRYDFGLFYASKTFYDPVKQRRVLWGWINEGDSEQDDLTKGWASLQGIPRQVWFDSKTGDHLIQWPVEEVDSLRKTQHNFGEITIEAGTVVPLSITPATQLDINIEMEFPTSENSSDSDSDYTCFNSGGASDRGLLGPFGLLVLAEKNLTEQTAIFFYVAKTSSGYKTYFCHDETRSSLATDLVLRTYGTDVPVISGEKLSLRILVDHSIVESFAQGGRQCITSRVYPTQAIYDAARVFLFNNATSSITVTKFSIWELDSANLHNYSE